MEGTTNPLPPPLVMYRLPQPCTVLLYCTVQSACASGGYRHSCRNGLALSPVIKLQQGEGRAKGRCSAAQTSLWPALPPSRQPTSHWSLSGKSDSHQLHLGRWGHSFSFEPDSGPMIVSRPQSPKGPLSFCKLRPIATPVRRNDEMRKDPPRPFDCRSDCQPDRPRNRRQQ